MTTPSRRRTPAILDTSFEQSLTATTIRGVYRLILFGTINATACALWFALWLPDWLGWGTQVLAVITIVAAAFIWLVFIRMICEYLRVAFGIHDQLVTIAHNTRREPARDPR